MLKNDYSILVIEDELSIRRFLKTAIVSQDYRFIEAKSGAEGLQMASEAKPDVILLDLGLPDMDGLQVIKKLRTWSSIPIVVLSARDQEQDKALALDMGADDYLSKPFSVVELNARIRVALRHLQRAIEKEAPVCEYENIRMDFINRELWVRNEKIQLTPIQYDMMAVLIRRANKIVTHKELLRLVWGQHHTEDVDYLRIYIYQLRHKLEQNPARPRYLKTEPGVGYRLICEDLSSDN
jgi:two-component system KDP operon response regulator KdpE